MIVNGSVLVNGFIGDAVFCTNIEQNEISKRLVKGLRKHVNVSKPWAPTTSVYVPIRIGTHQYETIVEMSVVYSATNSEDEVIFGRLFMDEHGVGFDEKERIIHSADFGEVSIGLLRPFEKIHSGLCIVDDKQGLLHPYNLPALMDQDRVIMLLDMDAFEVQVHQQNEENQHTIGKPTIVVNSANRVVAVSYEAKQMGINRSATPYAYQAFSQYSGLYIIQIPEMYPGRVDTSIVRDATERIVDTIKSTRDDLQAKYDSEITFEFASGDEFYMDVTKLVDEIIERHGWWPNPNGFLENTNLYDEDDTNLINAEEWIRIKKHSCEPPSASSIRLLHGAAIARRIIRDISRDTGFQASVGIGCNKTVAKIASGLHKPRSATIVFRSGFDNFSRKVPIKDVPGLGGKRGEAIKFQFGVEYMNELQNLQWQDVADAEFGAEGTQIGGKEAKKMLAAANGFCLKPVREIDCSMSVNLSQKFDGKLRDMVAI